MQIKRFLVFGASGRSGRQICRIAKKKQHYVVAVIRNPDQSVLRLSPTLLKLTILIPRAKDFEDAGIHTAIFDISKASPHEYVKLLHHWRAEVVVWAAGTSEDELAQTIDYGAQVNVYDAMEEAGVRRVMVVGSIGIWKEGTDWPEWYDEAASKSSLLHGSRRG